MLGRAELRMYLVAVKAFLSYVKDAVSVSVHSDGSLTNREQALLERHVPGIRVILHQAADLRAEKELKIDSLLRKWRNCDVSYRRLIDVELWRGSRKVIILDSDVLTTARPSEVIDWIVGGTRPFLLGQPPEAQQLPGAATPGAHVQVQFVEKVPEISARLGYPARFLQGATAGCCGYVDEISLDRIERLIRESLALGLPMDQWGGEQCIVIYLLSVGAGERLPAPRYLNFDPQVIDAVNDSSMIHFYGTHRFYRHV
jgi:hypothetical protein